MKKSQSLKQFQRTLLSSAVLAVAMSTAAQAATVSWSNPVDGSWGEASKWSGGTGVPVNGDDTRLLNTAAGAAYIVNYDAADAYTWADTSAYGVSPLMVQGSSYEAAVGNIVTLNINAPKFRVKGGNLGVSRHAIMNINDGGVVSAPGINLQTWGTLNLKPGGSLTTYDSAYSLNIGNDSAGSFNMTGGTLVAKGAEIFTSGTTTGGRGIGIGTAGGANNPGATMTVSGGDVSNDGRLTVGSYYSTTATSAYRTNGSLSMSDGTWLNKGNVLIGLNNAKQASAPALTDVRGSVEISGGTFTVNSGKKIYVGASSATGTLSVSGTGSLGTAAARVSEILVGTTFDYAANTWLGVNGNHVTVAGNGTFNLTGGNVYTDLLTAVNGAKSTVNISGGTLHTASTAVNTGTVLAIGDGTNAAGLDLLGGSHSFANGLNIKVNARLSGNGIISGAASIDGQLAIGGSTGTVSFNDGLVLGSASSSTFEFTNPTFAAGSYDLASSDGEDAVSFGGTLALNFSGTFANDTSVKIFSFASYGGAFSAVTFSGLAAGQQATFDATTGVVTISAIPEPASLGLLSLGGLLGLRRRR